MVALLVAKDLVENGGSQGSGVEEEEAYYLAAMSRSTDSRDFALLSKGFAGFDSIWNPPSSCV